MFLGSNSSSFDLRDIWKLVRKTLFIVRDGRCTWLILFIFQSICHVLPLIRLFVLLFSELFPFQDTETSVRSSKRSYVRSIKINKGRILGRFSWVLCIMFRVCMSVCYDIRDGLLAGSYVCTYGAILRIRLAEEYQLVENKQSREQQVWCVLNEYFR